MEMSGWVNSHIRISKGHHLKGATYGLFGLGMKAGHLEVRPSRYDLTNH